MWQLIVFIGVVAFVAAIGLVAFYKVPAINGAFKDAETLFLPALQAFVSAIVGALGYIDWGPLAGLVQSTGLKMEQVVGVAVVSFLQAIGLYVARRARDPAVKG
jgi:hypothetical protein